MPPSVRMILTAAVRNVLLGLASPRYFHRKSQRRRSTTMNDRPHDCPQWPACAATVYRNRVAVFRHGTPEYSLKNPSPEQQHAADLFVGQPDQQGRVRLRARG